MRSTVISWLLDGAGALLIIGAAFELATWTGYAVAGAALLLTARAVGDS